MQQKLQATETRSQATLDREKTYKDYRREDAKNYLVQADLQEKYRSEMIKTSSSILGEIGGKKIDEKNLVVKTVTEGTLSDAIQYAIDSSKKGSNELVMYKGYPIYKPTDEQKEREFYNKAKEQEAKDEEYARKQGRDHTVSQLKHNKETIEGFYRAAKNMSELDKEYNFSGTQEDPKE